MGGRLPGDPRFDTDVIVIIGGVRMWERLRLITCFAVSWIAFYLAGCAGPQPSDESAVATTGESKLVVFVVNYPLQYFAERVGGVHVQVEFPAPSDGDPAFWSPGAETVANYQGADLILLNGANYARWVDKVTLPPSKIVDTSKSARDRYVYIESGVTHSHGPGGEHTHGETAFTTWLDMTLAVEQARAIQEALTKAQPEHEGDFQKGFEALEQDLLGLDARLRAMVEGKNEKPLVGSHPAYQYLVRAYELNLNSVHFEPDEVPDDKAWHELEHILGDHPAKWMLWEGEPLPESKDKLKELGIESIVFNPCGNRPGEGDFLTVMENNLANLERVFSD
jgi:zinc transport system substrate-binding protein